MKSKEYIILGVIIVLLGAYLFLRNTNRSHYELPTLPAVADKDISRIEISTSTGTIDLTLSGDQWQIGKNKYPADASKVKEMLSALGSLKLTALVSEAGSYSRYDLTDDKKIQVSAWAGDRKIRDFAIGKTAETYRHTFVRLGKDPNVYQAEDNFRQTFDQTVEGLRDKTALSFKVQDITGIDIASGDRHCTLSLETPPAEKTASEAPSAEKATEPAKTEKSATETSSTENTAVSAKTEKTASETPSTKKPAEAAKPVWKAEDGTPADFETVKRLLSQLGYLNCSQYLENKKKEDFREPILTVTLKGTKTYSLSLFSKDASQKEYPAISSQNDYPFSLDETTYKRLKDTVEKLLGTKTGT